MYCTQSLRWVSRYASQPPGRVRSQGFPSKLGSCATDRSVQGSMQPAAPDPWHIKAPGPKASRPLTPLLRGRPLQKPLRRITDLHQRALDITHTSRPAKKIWLKAYYRRKVGGKRRDLAGIDSDIYFTDNAVQLVRPSEQDKTTQQNSSAYSVCFPVFPRLVRKCFTLHVSGHSI